MLRERASRDRAMIGRLRVRDATAAELVRRGAPRDGSMFGFLGKTPKIAPMASDRTVTANVVRKVAALSRLRVPEEELPLWTEQLARIVSYIDQIEQIPEEDFPAPGPPPATPLRADDPRPGEGRAALEANAPKRFEGFGVVPRVVGGE
jgi:aspartyl-tRNA(Asn)/glutamyl-tRNA(Gln) amidotransferase subunit C